MVLRAVIVVAMLAAGCGKATPRPAGEIKADGSSTVYPLTSAVAEEFTKKNPEVKISVGISGTTGGFEKFCQSAIDVQNASRPITADERATCERSGVSFIEVPVAYDAVTVVVHPSNQWATSMTLAELKRLWEPQAERKVTRWSDIRTGWPNEPVALFGPGAASGTFDYFTEAVVGQLRASRKDYTASEDDGVIVNGVASNPHAVGYVGYGHFNHNASRLRAVAIEGPHADRLGAVLPSVDNVQRGAYFPLSRPLLIYVNAKSLDRPAMAEFVNFYLKQDADIVRQVGGIPMSARVYELVRHRVTRKVPGSLFEAAGDASLELRLAQAQ